MTRFHLSAALPLLIACSAPLLGSESYDVVKEADISKALTLLLDDPKLQQMVLENPSLSLKQENEDGCTLSFNENDQVVHTKILNTLSNNSPASITDDENSLCTSVPYHTKIAAFPGVLLIGLTIAYLTRSRSVTAQKKSPSLIASQKKLYACSESENLFLEAQSTPVITSIS